MSNRITVASMQLTTIAFNLAPASGVGNANVSVTLRDPVSGYQAHFVYEDTTTTPAYWANVSALQLGGASWVAKILNRLMTDGKLPAGTLS